MMIEGNCLYLYNCDYKDCNISKNGSYTLKHLKRQAWQSSFMVYKKSSPFFSGERDYKLSKKGKGLKS